MGPLIFRSIILLSLSSTKNDSEIEALSLCFLGETPCTNGLCGSPCERAACVFGINAHFMGQLRTHHLTSGTSFAHNKLNSRYAQFLKVFPVPKDAGRMERRTAAILKKLEERGIDWKTDYTDTQKKMLGLVPYESSETSSAQNDNNQ